ncbi:MAG: hypothetical protein ABL958_05685 [Bdellovibrionia bacterium]
MKFALIAAALVLSSTASFAQAPKRILGDCTYVSLNNAIRIGFAQPGAVSFQISKLSYERKIELDKKQVVVLDVYSANNPVPKQVGYEFTMTDAEDGFCRLEGANSIVQVKDEDIKKLTELEDVEGLPAHLPQRYMGDCKTAGVNFVIAEAVAVKSKGITIGFTSAGSPKTNYSFFVSPMNDSIITVNPNSDKSQIGVKQTGESLLTVKIAKSATSCTASK